MTTTPICAMLLFVEKVIIESSKQATITIDYQLIIDQ